MFTIMINNDGIGLCKSENKINKLSQNEIEITEEQYEQMNDFPLKLTLDENGKIVAWEKTEIEYEPVIEQQTLEEQLEELKQLVADLASLQLGV